MDADQKKAELLQALNRQFRFTSANSVIFSQVIADKVGIHSTDNECLDFLLLNGPATAGQLAEWTGLTTGAVTAMIDRLEKAGYVQRERDPTDRRKVIVVPNEAKIGADIMPYPMQMGEMLAALCEEFSAEELEIVLKFVTKANTAATAVIAKVRNAGLG